MRWTEVLESELPMEPYAPGSFGTFDLVPLVLVNPGWVPRADREMTNVWEQGREKDENIRVEKTKLQLQSCYSSAEVAQEIGELVSVKTLEIAANNMKVDYTGEGPKNSQVLALDL